MPDLLKSAFLMRRSEGELVPSGKIPFVYRDGDDKIRHFLLLDPEVYADMGFDAGSTDVEITVVIYPGDTLNEEAT